jgi:hypothetical protein
MSKSVWGPATWQLLHSMVLKINDNVNQSQIKELKMMIINIASNLPCPYCTQHALNYLKTNHFDLIDNIFTIRMFMHKFHNDVNIRLKKPTMTYEEHIILYNRMNLKLVLQNMLAIYKNMNSSVTMMLYSYYRYKLVQDLNDYFYKNQGLYRL